MKEKNNLLRIASILMIVCAVVAIVISAVNINSTMSGMANLGGAERAAIEAQLNENNLVSLRSLMCLKSLSESLDSGKQIPGRSFSSSGESFFWCLVCSACPAVFLTYLAFAIF